MCLSGIEEQLIIQPGACFPWSLSIPPQAIQTTNNNDNTSRQWSTPDCDGSVRWVKEAKQKAHGFIFSDIKKGKWDLIDSQGGIDKWAQNTGSCKQPKKKIQMNFIDT